MLGEMTYSPLERRKEGRCRYREHHQITEPRFSSSRTGYDLAYVLRETSQGRLSEDLEPSE